MPGDRSRPDVNNISSLLALSSAGDGNLVVLYADPTTHGLVISGGVAGTQYAELATTTPGTGTLALGRYKSSAPTLTDGQVYGLQLDASGNLKVTGSLSVGGTTDAASWTTASSTFNPGGGVFNDTATALTSGQQGTQRLTAQRATHINIRNNSGTELGIAATPLRVDPTGTTTQPVSIAASVAVTGTFWQATQPVSFTQPALVAGTALIGKVGIDQTTVGTTNAVSLAQLGANAVLTGNGVTGTGSLRVTVASDNTAFSVNPTASTSSGPGLLYSATPTGGTATAVKASAGNMTGYYMFNPNASTAYVQFFNLGTGSVTPGTTAPLFSIPIPAGAAANLADVAGIYSFSTALSIVTSTTRAGSTAPGTALDVTVFGK